MSNNHGGASVAANGRRVAGGAALVTLVTSLASLFVLTREDVGTQAALRDYLARASGRMAAAWVFAVLSGLAWLGFVAAMRRLLPTSGGRDLFVAAAVAGQATSWAGVSLASAAAPAEAREVPLAVFHAFGEAGHLAGAAGTAALGLALVGAASAGRRPSASRVLPRWFWAMTSVVGVLLVPAAVAGPVALPLTWLWLLGVALLLLRRPSHCDRLQPTFRGSGRSDGLDAEAQTIAPV